MLRPLLGCAALFLLAIARRRKRGALRGQSVLITGANSGIGRELALQAARLGVKELILVDLELMEDVVREARQRGGDALRISTHQTDVSNEEAVASLCAEIEVQVVLLSAGVVSGKAFLPCEAQQSPVASAEFRKTMDTNFFGSAWFAHQLLPSMLQRRCGAVVFLSSMMGFLGSARLSDYCASKWALLGLTESIRLELRAQQCTGVGVMAVCPYLVDTQMFNGAFEGADSATVFRQCVAWLRSLVFAKLSAKDVAAAILAELDDDLASLPPQSHEALLKRVQEAPKGSAPHGLQAPESNTIEAVMPSEQMLKAMQRLQDQDTMFLQRQVGGGIFGCDGFDVFSDQAIDIDGYKTKVIPSTVSGVSVDGTAANSQVFLKTWMAILTDDKWWHYDFIAKVDPDAILYAERLRGHLQWHVGQDVFFLNCAKYIPATMYGALEVFSKAALGAYLSQHERCEHSLPFWSWGEDRYMAGCLEMLGVQTLPDYMNFLHDERCWGVDCGNKAAVAFHSFKQVNHWYRCYESSK
ncbi:unnamed protein product [Durusdinium trenchii]|uniref:Ketoreductase domain-containing protein n=1 Tax=Durusdinium trenchii TaxID=1381693 RepID=A0ABP0IJX2_9DINO